MDRSRPSERRHPVVAVGLVLVVVALAGCLSGGDPAGTATPSPAPTGALTSTETPASTAFPAPSGSTAKPDAGLDSTLSDLTEADDASAFAERHGLTLAGDRVLVLVRLGEGKTLPPSFDLDVTAREDRRVNAYVAVDRLRALAAHENTTFVRPPERPAPAGVDGGPNG